MLNENIEDLGLVGRGTPEEAASNIKGAMGLDITPDGYAQLKPQLDTLVAKNDTPPVTSPVIAERMVQSEQHATVMKPDLKSMNAFSKYISFAGETLKGKEINRDIFNLAYRKALGGELDEDEEFQLLQDNQRLKELNSAEEYGYGFWESVPAEVLGAGYDFVEGIRENLDLVALGAGTGAVAGGVLGIGAGLPGVLAVGGLGAVKGASIGVGVAKLKDVFTQSTGQIYNDLSFVLKESDELKIPKAERERQEIAVGGGVLMSAIGYLPVQQAAKNIPWLQKIINPRAFVKHALGPQGGKYLNLAKAIGRSGLVEGIEEGSQEVITILANEMGQTWDGSETSFITGLTNAAGKWEEYSKQVAAGAVIGAVAGATFTGAARAGGAIVETVTGPSKLPEVPTPKPKSDISGEASNVSSFNKGTKALQLKIAMDQSKVLLDSTKTKQLLPQELELIQKGIFEQAGINDVYLDKDDLNSWANTEEKVAAVRKLLGGSEVIDADINAPVRLDAYKWAKMSEQFPDATDIMKADPEGPTTKSFLERLDNVRKAQQELKDKIPSELPVGDTLEKRMRDEDIFNENDYLSQPTFTEGMYSVLPQKEILRINEAQLTARTEVADAIQADANKQMNQVIDFETEMNLLTEREFQADSIETDPEIRIVDFFLKEGMSINPDTLPKRLQNKFLGDEALKSRKVFSKEGVSLEDAVMVTGAKNAQSLLTILSSRPTKDQAVDAAVEANRADIELETASNVDFDESRLAKAYNNMTRNHLKELKILRDKYWPALKSGIRRVALPLPSLVEIQTEARKRIGSLRIKDINPNQWKVGERKSQRLAVNAILKNETEVAFREKRNAALNSQLAKEAHIATGKANRAFKFMSRLSTPRMQSLLKEAGPTYRNAISSLLDLYNFNPRSSTQNKIESYQKYAEKMRQEGRGEFTIPDDVLEWLTPATSAKELTVDQLLYVTDMAKGIVNQAKLKNKLLGKYEADMENTTSEIIAETAKEQAQAHPAYDEKKLLEPQGVVTFGSKLSKWINQADTNIKNVQHVVQELDQGKLNGFWSKLLFQPLQGTGIHEGPYGKLAETKLQGDLRKRVVKEIKAYGKKAWTYMGATRIQVAEFKNVPELNNGNLTKLDLFVMAMHMGNPENISRLENFGVERAVIMQALEKYLTTKDMDFIQSTVWDTFFSYKGRIAAVEKATKGVEVQFVEAQPFTFQGKEYRGGYFPIKYKRDASVDKLQAMQDEKFKSADPGNTNAPANLASFEGIVRSPHTKARVGSEWVLDLDIETMSRGFEEVIHDVTMRVPVRDTMLLLKDKTLASSVISVVGQDKYKLLVNSIAEETNSSNSDMIQLFGENQKFLNQAMNSLESAAAVSYILFNPSSVVMSTLPFGEVAIKMGGMGQFTKYFSKSAVKFLNPLNMNKWGQIYDFASEIDPSIRSAKEGLDDFVSAALSDILPKKRVTSNKVYHLGRGLQDSANKFGFQGVLGGIDQAVKTLTVISSYSQYMAGDAPGVSFEMVQAMTPAEREANAKGYAAQLSNSTTMAAKRLDKAAIQKSPLGKIFTRFWNEQRNALNNRIQDSRNFKYSADRAVTKAKQGDYLGANLELSDMGTRASNILIFSMLGMIISSFARGKNPFAFGEEEGEELTVDESIERIPEYALTRLTTLEGVYDLSKQLILGQIPIVRDMVFSGETGRAVSAPALSVATDIAATVPITVNYVMNVMGDMTMLEAAEALGPYEVKKILMTTSFMAGGLPVSGPVKIYNWFSDDENTLAQDVGGGLLGTFIEALQRFIGIFSKPEEMTDDELFEQLKRQKEGKSTEIEQAVDDAKSILARLDQGSPQDPLPDAGYEFIKYAESGGKWNARPYQRDSKGKLVYDKEGNPKTASSAFGLYQFTKGTWEWIMNHPEGRRLGLIEEGRLSRSSKQQEKAMKFLTAYNAQQLRKRNVPVNIETLYFAHHFGIRHADKVYSAPDKTSIRSLLTKEVVEANPNLKKAKTVADIKDYIREALERGRRGYEKKTGTVLTSR